MFCAFIQQAGRAGRDFETLGEAILIVLKRVLKEGVSNEDVNSGVSDTVIDAEALNRELEEAELTQSVVGVLDEEGIRVADDSNSTEKESISK